MKYNIEILSQDDAIEFYNSYNGKEKVLFLSISDKEGELIFNKSENIILHQTYFEDLDKPLDGHILMNYVQASKIKEIVDLCVNNGITQIKVHCYAGISRSGAVGCVLARYLNNDDIYLWKQGNICPNIWVYKVMCEEFNIPYSDKDFKYRQRISNRVLNKSFRDYGITIEDMFPEEIED